MREGIVSIDTNIQAIYDKKLIWGNMGRWLNDIPIDTENIYSHRGP